MRRQYGKSRIDGGWVEGRRRMDRRSRKGQDRRNSRRRDRRSRKGQDRRNSRRQDRKSRAR
jgi:hypothetical protein